MTDEASPPRPSALSMDALVARRIASGLTQDDIAERMGVTQSAVSRIESATNPGFGRIRRYAAAVDVPVELAVGGE